MVSNKSNFNQVLWLGIGQVSTFLVTFLSGVILSRYFNKEDYGTFRQVLFVYNILFTVFSSGLATAYSYFIPKYNDAESKTIVSKITNILVVFGIVLSLILFLGAEQISIFMNNDELKYAIRLFCLTPLFSLPAIGVESLYTAIRNTKVIAIYHVIGKLMMLLCSVLPVIIWDMGYEQAIIGWSVASFITFIFAFILKWAPYKHVTSCKIENVYRKVADFALPLMGAAIVGLFLNSATQVFISRYWGSSSFADYSNGFIGLPFVAMVAGPVKSLLQPLFSKAEKEGTLQNALGVYENGVIHCIIILLPLILFCFFFAKDIIVFIYGAKYSTAYYYFRLSLIKDIAVIFPYMAILLAFGRSKVYFYVHLIAALLLWSTDLILVYICNKPFSYALAYTLIEIMIPFSMIIYIIRNLKLDILGKYLVTKILKVGIHSILILFCFRLIYDNVFEQLNLFWRLSSIFTLFIISLMITGRFIHIEYYTDILKRLRN